MNRVRLLACSAIIGATAILTTGCPSTPTCQTSNCNGCCSPSGECLAGNQTSACGLRGVSCSQCQAGQFCSSGLCQGSGGGTGGGTTGGAQGGTGGATGGTTGGALGGTTGGAGGGTTGGTGGGTTGGAGGGTTGGAGGGTTGGAVGGTTGGAVGGTTGGAVGGTTGGTSGGANTNEQIAAVREAADRDAGAVALPVSGALVTYLKPFVRDAGASDPSGFFVQASQAGPAVFVEVDPGTISGGPVAVGDSVSFVTDSVALRAGVRAVTGVSQLTIHSRANPVSGLIQSVSSVPFATASNIDVYEGELVSLQCTVTGAFTSASSGYLSAPITTAGTPTSGTALQARLPTTLAESEDLTQGCTTTLEGVPLWRFNNRAQPSPFAPGEVTAVTCPAPRVTGAAGTSNTTARVTFDRNLRGSSVTTGAFVISPALAVSQAVLTGAREVTLTTAAQTGGTTYTVVVSGVVDTRGVPIGSTGNSGSFSGVGVNNCSAPVVISQIYGAGGNQNSVLSHDFVELHNRTDAGVSLADWSLHYQSAAANWPSSAANKFVFDAGVVIPAGGFLLIQMATGGGDAGPLPTPDFVGSLAMSASSGKVVLASTSNDLASDAGCPVGAVVDFVGYGSPNCSESAPAATLSATLAVFRRDVAEPNLACSDTNSNAADFVAQTPAPRNSSTAALVCTCP